MARERDSAQRAALRRFPEQAASIAQLLARSEAFRDMCEELSEAEAALARVQAKGIDARARSQECEIWILRLTVEIGQALEGLKAAK